MMPPLPEFGGADPEILMDASAEAVIVFDAAYRFLYLNAEGERLIGLPRDEVLGRIVWDVFPETRAAFYGPMSRALREGVPTTFSVEYGPTGALVEGRCIPLQTAGDAAASDSAAAALAVFVRDVTERREVEVLRASEESLRASLDALRASEERFRLLVEGVKDYAIFMLDPEGYITTWNAGARRFKDYTADEIIGQHFSRFYTPEDIARRHPWKELEIASREGRYEEEGWRVRKDGSRFWASVVITALYDSVGRLRGFGKVTRDMTERHEREQERAAAHVAEQQRRFLKEVLASVTQGKLILCDTRAELPMPPAPAPVSEPVSLNQEAALRVLRDQARTATEECGFPRERQQDFLTGLSEAAMNALRHGGGGTARLFADPLSGRLQAWVEDQGKGIDLSTLPRATLELGYSSAGTLGHGFWLMLQTCDRIYLRTGEEGTTVVLEQERVSPVPAWLHDR